MAMVCRVSSSPTHSLATVIKLAKSGPREMTESARRTALTELGLDRAGVFAAVALLTEGDFYKTMESETFPGRFQDVYRPVVVCPLHPAGVQVYCKVQLAGAVLVLSVISFKRK